MMENGTMEMRMRALLDAGDADGACVFARAYLAQSAAERNAEETYALRVLLGETLLALAAESFDESVYIEGATALMQAYNECGDEELYALLYALSCAPNETACRMRYEAGRTALMSGADMPRVQLPDYENLFVRLFPLTDRYSVLFDREEKQFFVHTMATGVKALCQALLSGSETTGETDLCRRRLTRDRCLAEGALLAERLAAAIGARDFGAAAQAVAEDYRRLRPYGELYEMFYAEAALAAGNEDTALRCAKGAYQKRKMNRDVGSLLSRAYRAAGQSASALKFQTLFRLGDPPVHEQHGEHLRSMAAALLDMRFAPVIDMVCQGTQGSSVKLGVLVGEELPRFSEALPSYRTGIYNPYGQMVIKDKLLDLMNTQTKQYGIPIYNDFVFDVMKADETDEIHVQPEGDAPILLPVAAKQERQQVFFSGPELNRDMILSRGEFNFFRVDTPVTFRSEAPFVVGAPIVLRHSPHRKKFVLNILADGLSWPEVRRSGYALMPNLMRFFGKGIIFENHYSGSEYTYPSLATIETGLFQHHTQIAKPGVPFTVAPAYMTLSEQMKALGYYCVNVQGDGEGIYNGVTRGYDRLIVNHVMYHAAEGIERTIRHLEAFGECDNFIFTHFADTHPYNSDVSTPICAQTHLPLADLLQPQDTSASVFLRPNPLSRYVNHEGIKTADRHLGHLFDYIEAHYAEDEYIVLLYSDHGTSVHARSPYLMSEEQTGAALMARGAGVPQRGCVDELVSTVDIYKLLGHLAGYPIDASHLDGNLPEAFGGRRRTYTVSNSIYPGQTYKICVRTDRHAFHLETAEPTAADGKISLDRYTYHIHERDEQYREVFDDRLARYFMDIVWQYTESFLQ